MQIADLPAPSFDRAQIAMIGLGYVGLLLAVEFGKQRATVGCDIEELRAYDIHADTHDPWASREEAEQEYGLALTDPKPGANDAIVLAVAHSEYRGDGA